MASQFSFAEENGAAAGTPPSGTRTINRTDVNWKSVDDSATAYSAAPIVAGGNSFTKFQYGMISGTFNQVLNGKFGHTTGILGAGLTLQLYVTGNYATPATGTFSSGVNATLSSGIAAQALTVLFSTTGPNTGLATSISTVATGYTSYLISQLQTTTGASPGDTATVTLTLQYDEN